MYIYRITILNARVHGVQTVHAISVTHAITKALRSAENELHQKTHWAMYPGEPLIITATRVRRD